MLARFLIGQMLGIGFGTALAGWLGEHFCWRAVFWLLAGVLFGISALLGFESKRHPAPAAPPRITEGFARMPRVFALPHVRGLLATGYFEGFLIFGALAFVALHFQRSFGLCIRAPLLGLPLLIDGDRRPGFLRADRMFEQRQRGEQ